MIRIKCCGMTRVDDALLAARLGVDAVGVVFAARSKRRLTPDQAAPIVAAMPAFVTTVALFMDDDAQLVRQVIGDVRPDMLQFHGRETDAWCSQFERPFLKAIAMGEGAAALATVRDYPHARGVLLDGHGAGEVGGSGKTFDWSLIPDDLAHRLILAGGLVPENVAAAIHAVRPWAVDVASGIESSPDIKDPVRMAAFIQAVRAADAAR